MYTHISVVKDSEKKKKSNFALPGLSRRLIFYKRNHIWILPGKYTGSFSCPAAHRHNWVEWDRTQPFQWRAENVHTDPLLLLLHLASDLFSIYNYIELILITLL